MPKELYILLVYCLCVILMLVAQSLGGDNSMG